MNIFNVILINPIINILAAIYQGLVYLHIPYPLGFSIILLTLASRFVLLPFTNSTIRHSKKMQSLNPHLSKLKEKHKGDAKTLQAETMKLYKEHGVNPAAGCLPALIQIPIALGLYNALREAVNTSGSVVASINKVLYFPSLHLHKVWDIHFFGLPLGSSPAQLLHSYGPLIFLVPVLTAAFQMIQSKMMFTTQPQPAAQPEKQLAKKDEKTEKKASNSDDFAAAMQTQSIYFIPLIIGYSSFTFPLGLSLYWNTFTIFGIIQQYYISGLGGLEDWIKLLQRKS